MDKQKKVWVVLYPDGSLATGGTSPISRSHALRGALTGWLDHDWFKGIDWGSLSFGPLHNFWQAMERNGWKILEIEVPTTTPKEPHP